MPEIGWMKRMRGASKGNPPPLRYTELAPTRFKSLFRD